MPNRFSLDKYYLDAVTDSGDFLIGYYAKLRFGELSLCYSDTVHSNGIEGVAPGPSFDRRSTPVSAGQSLTWNHTRLGVQGRWTSLSPPVRKELLSTSEGCVDWNCLQPGSKVKLHTSSGMAVEALGYCESLGLTIAPWRLGLKELIWGRFVSESDCIVWLEWKGEHKRRLLFWNGAQAELVSIRENAVEARRFSIALNPVETVRDGYLGPNILSKVPAVKRLAPATLLQVHEHKQLCRGVLTTSEGDTKEGWVIHETVVWPG